MDEKLLSIVIPTKNRMEYVKSFIECVCSFQDKRIELVIQDNSDSNKEMISFLESLHDSSIVYKYINEPVSMVENSELAVGAASGRYICFMGDDDLVSKKLVDFVEQMEQHGIESAIFARNTSYFWPGVIHKAHKFPSLIIKKYKGQIRKINVKKEYQKFLRQGAISMEKLPQLYHGVVSRKCLEKVHEISGSFFPAPCPDMAVCVGLSYVVRKHLFCDVPLILSGAAPKSAAALGAKHMHKEKIEKVASLPKETAKHWEEKVPRIWTEQTIYAESAIKSMKNMKRGDDEKKFNYPYFYAGFFVFNIKERKLLKSLLKKLFISERIRFCFYAIDIILVRVRVFIENIFISRFHKGRLCWDHVSNSFEAEKIIDNQIKDVNIAKMFEQIGLEGNR